MIYPARMVPPSRTMRNTILKDPPSAGVTIDYKPMVEGYFSDVGVDDNERPLENPVREPQMNL